ncbi:MAG: hypothetical protein ACYCVB_05195 [Bacilli bacterium]
MTILNRFRSALSGRYVCPPDHLEGYRRIGESLYAAEAELSETASPRTRAILAAARCLRIMADALLAEVFVANGGSEQKIPVITQKQAETWYDAIPRLIAAARKETAFSGAAGTAAPLRLPSLLRGPLASPIDHLTGLRRAAQELHELIQTKIELARFEPTLYREAILRYEETRTRREQADAIARSVRNGESVLPADLHAKAEQAYASALSSYLLVAQWLEDPTLQPAGSPARRPASAQKDQASETLWRVSSTVARRQIRRAGEGRKAEQELRQFWLNRTIPDAEREFEATVARLLAEGRIRENGYWHRCPFQSSYAVGEDPVALAGQTIPQGHSFLWMYDKDGESSHLVVRAAFHSAPFRDYRKEGGAPQ